MLKNCKKTKKNYSPGCLSSRKRSPRPNRIPMTIYHIQELSQNIFNEVVANRRHIHANPELSFHEVETSAFVAKKLEDMGLEYHKMANTGLVALIKGDKPSDQVVALRADMDALPILEAND